MVRPEIWMKSVRWAFNQEYVNWGHSRLIALGGDGRPSVQAVNVPVTVGGMDVAPAELIHMDENGAVKFPADKLEAALSNVRALQKDEEARMSALQQASSAAEVRAIFGGQSYAAKHEK